MHQTEIAHHRENRQWAVLLRPFLVAVTLGLVLALDLAQVLTLVRVVVRIRVAVFVFLYFGVFGGVLLSLSSVFSRILVLSLYCTRCHQARESNTEHSISNENIKSHFLSLLLKRDIAGLLLLYAMKHGSRKEVVDSGL